jgi:RNA polymerase sigma factor (sigma-70 family)
MTDTTLTTVVRSLRGLCTPADAREEPDGQLLSAFLTGHDETAFTTLVGRHGPMVLGVCRRVLHHAQDAEDCFQATFLLLARRGASIRKRESLGSWLHGVAFRMANNSKRAGARRRRHEAQARPTTPANPAWTAAWHEVQALLDEEVQRLPAAYREAFVLCCLEGTGCAEAARRLGLQEGTVWSRVNRARGQLRARLARRGVVLTALLGAATVSGNVARAEVARALTSLTVRAAARVAAGESPRSLVSSQVAALLERVNQAMFTSKLKVTSLLLLALCLAGVGFGALLAQAPDTRARADDKPPPARQPAADGEDPLPDGAVLRLGTTQGRAAGALLAVTADGKSIISVRGGKYVRVWDLKTGKPRESRELPSAESSVSVLSPGGEYLATEGTKRGTFAVWDVARGKLVREYQGPDTNSVAHVAFSPDGKRLAAVCSWDGVHTVRAWDLDSGKEVFSKEVRTPESARLLGFTPDGKRLLAAFTSSKEGTYCWDVASGEVAWQNKEACPDAVVFTPDGKVYPSRRELPVLDAATGREVGKAAAGWGNDVLLSADGRTLFTADPEGLVIWDVTAEKEVRKLPVKWPRMAVTPDGKGLVTTDGQLQYWDLATGKPAYPDNADLGHVGEVTALAFEASGKRLVTAGLDDSVRVWDLGTGKPVQVWRPGDPQHPSPPTGNRPVEPGVLGSSPDGRWVVRRGEGRLTVWDEREGKLGRELPLPDAGPGAVSPTVLHAHITADGSRVVAVTGPVGFIVTNGNLPVKATHSLATWDVSTGKLVGVQSVELWVGRSMAFSPDGRWLLQRGALLDTATGAVVVWLEKDDPDAAGGPYAFSPDGSLLVGVCNKRVEKEGAVWLYPDGARVWEVATGRVVTQVASGETVLQLDFDATGRFVIGTGFEGVRGWDVLSGKKVFERDAPEKVRSLTGRGYYFTCTALSPDGKLLATGMPDGTALVWKVKLPGAVEGERLGDEGLKKAWDELTDGDAARAWQALRRLAAVPGEAVPFLRTRLEPVKPAPPDQTRALVADLDSEDFRRREEAAGKLEALGVRAEPALRAALKGMPSAEQRRRIEGMLGRLEGASAPASPAEVREVRAVAALRLAGTDEARRLLRELAGGVERARLTREARAALPE